MVQESTVKISSRAKEIAQDYIHELDKHILELKTGAAEKIFEIQDLADKLHIHPTHLSNTLHDVLQQSPCELYENRLLALSKELLLSSNKSIAEIARQLYYDPSNFTKFFKHFAGITPKEFRKQNLQ